MLFVDFALDIGFVSNQSGWFQHLKNFFALVTGKRQRAIALCLLFLLSFGASSLLYWQRQGDRQPIYIAVPASLTGEEADGGEETVHSVQMYLDLVNRKGGISGHQIKLLSFDDQGDEDEVEAIAQNIVQSQALIVLGHRSTALSTIAGEVYRQAELAAITGTANTDSLTLDNPYYFRTVYMRSAIAKVQTIYVQQVLKRNTASIIRFQGDDYGEDVATEFTDSFTANGGTIRHDWQLSPDNIVESMAEVVQELSADPSSDFVFLAAREEEQVEAMVVPIRRQGLKIMMMGPQPLAREELAQRFEAYPEEEKQPGFFTNNIYVPSPGLLDSAGADGQSFADSYTALYNKPPSYVGFKFYEAAMMAVEALRNASLSLKTDPASIRGDRQQVYAALNGFDSEQKGIYGLSGLLYFSGDRSMNHLPVGMAQFQRRQLISAPEQFTSVTNGGRVSLAKELAAGNILRIGDDYFWRQHVVYTGIDLNRLSSVDQKSSSFTAEFYLWFRSPIDQPVVPNVEFPDGKSLIPNQPLFNPSEPIESDVIEGLNYRLYQVRGQFKSRFDLRDYPFDEQQLKIRFQNTSIPSDRLIYVIDTFGLRLPKVDGSEERKRYSTSTWNYKGIQYAKETFRTSSTEGDPRLFATDNRVDFSGLSATITMKRRSLIFLVKNLLPLILLSLVPMMTLYFPKRLAKEGPPIAVSALISGTVLLVGMYKQLPEIGYTTAIEYVFYIFFGLSVFSILVGIVSDHLLLRGETLVAKRLDWSARITYVLAIVVTVVIFWIVFGD
jgi:branched-chain amino acid transport system substrate-binding protein